MSNKPFIIGIAGGSGSGKTFFLNSFLHHFKQDEVTLVSQDDYYIPVAHNMTKEENKLYNFDLPSTIDADLFESDISKLMNWETVYQKEYTFNNPDVVPKILEIKPAPIIIVEGLFVFHYPEIAKLFDLKIFMDADEEITLNRRISRDEIERGYTRDMVMYQWVNHVMPAYKQYLLPYKESCQKVIMNNKHVADDIISISKEISDELKETVLMP